MGPDTHNSKISTDTIRNLPEFEHVIHHGDGGGAVLYSVRVQHYAILGRRIDTERRQRPLGALLDGQLWYVDVPFRLRPLTTFLSAWFAELIVPQFEALKGGTVKIELIETPFGQLAGDIINEAKSKIGLYDGFLTPPSVTGSVVGHDGWADLSSYINESAENIQDWSDILLGYRKYVAQYENKILMYPLDGDVLSLYYRKDILKAYGFDHPPRTWKEYEEIAATVHGEIYGNTTLVGSCVARMKGCALPYFTNLILSSITQTRGPREGHLFDTGDFTPLTGQALLQTLLIMGEIKSSMAPTRNLTVALRPSTTRKWPTKDVAS